VRDRLCLCKNFGLKIENYILIYFREASHLTDIARTAGTRNLTELSLTNIGALITL
jgi:hypothetical protein